MFLMLLGTSTLTKSKSISSFDKVVSNCEKHKLRLTKNDIIKGTPLKKRIVKLQIQNNTYEIFVKPCFVTIYNAIQARDCPKV